MIRAIANIVITDAIAATRNFFWRASDPIAAGVDVFGLASKTEAKIY
jgi:hypothetical protein